MFVFASSPWQQERNNGSVRGNLQISHRFGQLRSLPPTQPTGPVSVGRSDRSPLVLRIDRRLVGTRRPSSPQRWTARSVNQLIHTRRWITIGANFKNFWPLYELFTTRPLFHISGPFWLDLFSHFGYTVICRVSRDFLKERGVIFDTLMYTWF